MADHLFGFTLTLIGSNRLSLEGMIMNQCTRWFVVKSLERGNSKWCSDTGQVWSAYRLHLRANPQGWWIWTANSIHEWHLLEAPRTKEASKQFSPSHWCRQEAAPLLRVRVDRQGLADSAGRMKASKMTSIQFARSSVLPSTFALNFHNICQMGLKFQQSSGFIRITFLRMIWVTHFGCHQYFYLQMDRSNSRGLDLVQALPCISWLWRKKPWGENWNFGSSETRGCGAASQGCVCVGLDG